MQQPVSLYYCHDVIMKLMIDFINVHMALVFMLMITTCIQICLYSSKTNSWGPVINCPFDFLWRERSFVYLWGGFICWLSNEGIVSLNLADESIALIQVPDYSENNIGDETLYARLTVIGGQLAIHWDYNLWVMNEEGLWTKFSLNRLREYIDIDDMRETQIFDAKNGKVWVCKSMKGTLLMYDIEKEVFGKKMYFWDSGLFIWHGTFEESLTSPDFNNDGEGDSGLEEVVKEDFSKSVEDQSIGKSRSEPSTSSGLVSDLVDLVDGKTLESLDAHDCLHLLDESDRKHDEWFQNLNFDIEEKDVLVEPFCPLTVDEEKMVGNALFVSSRRKPCLNDEVINLYIELLKQREKEPKEFLECHFLDTFFYKKLKCENCGEVTEKATCVSLNETVLGAKKGTTNLMRKCKFCKREGTITMIPGKGYPLTINLSDTGKHASLMPFDCRGIEPLDFAFSNGWKAESLKGAKFVDIDLAGEEFAEYDDEKGECGVMMSSLDAEFKAVDLSKKGFSK